MPDEEAPDKEAPDETPEDKAPEDKAPDAPRKRWWRRKLVRRLAILAVAGVLGVVLLVAGSVIWVRSGADGHLYTEQAVPAAPVALVLGAQVYEEARRRRSWRPAWTWPAGSWKPAR
ncbi:hypothetical protein [Dactylosporangium cerinum]